MVTCRLEMSFSPRNTSTMLPSAHGLLTSASSVFFSSVFIPGEASLEFRAGVTKIKYMSAQIAWNMATSLLLVGKFFLPTQCLVHLAILASSQPLHPSRRCHTPTAPFPGKGPASWFLGHLCPCPHFHLTLVPQSNTPSHLLFCI